MSTYGGHKSPSVQSDALSTYSHASTTRSTRTLGAHSRGRSLKSQKVEWYQKPLISSAFYTDLTTGAWHATFYTLFLSCWTLLWSLFDVYCLVETLPGSNHTGYYMFSFEFVFVGNHHVWNLLMISSVISTMCAIAIFISSCMLLDALRLEKETGFKSWLFSMAFFTPWRFIAWVFASIANDMIFGYHIFMFLSWIILHVLNVMSFLIIYSMYLELTGISKLEQNAKVKMATLSRAGITYGSRPTSPAVRQPPPGGSYSVPYSDLNSGPSTLRSEYGQGQGGQGMGMGSLAYSGQGSMAYSAIPGRQSHF